MAIPIDERAILDALRRVPVERWGDVLHYLDTLGDAGPGIRNAEDLDRSGLIGMWSDRDDLGDSREFARRLRRQAETRRGAADAAGY